MFPDQTADFWFGMKLYVDTFAHLSISAPQCVCTATIQVEQIKIQKYSYLTFDAHTLDTSSPMIMSSTTLFFFLYVSRTA